MATYKVLQDIEAEDKFLGPLTLKQFIFGSIAVVCIYLAVVGFSRGTWIPAVLFAPFVFVFGFLAWPWGRDQPTEVWLVAKIRFFFKPRKRIWNQTGLQELVEITVPKVSERQLTNNLSQIEVKSRLRALANTLDSRGWAVKNVNVNLFATPAYAVGYASDRLIDPSSLPHEVPNYDVVPSDDMLDPQSNPVAQHLSSMIQSSKQTRRTELVEKLKHGGDSQLPNLPNDYWFMNQPPAAPAGYATFPAAQTLQPGVAGDSAKGNDDSSPDAALLKQAKAKPDTTLAHLHKLQPKGKSTVHSPQSTAEGSKLKAPSSTAAPDPAILNLANNDDLNVATIAREANKATTKNSGNDEVVISLR